MANKLVSLNSIVVPKNDIDVTELNGEKVMMDLDKGKYFMLNGTGSVIWDCIIESKTISQIIEKLLNEYDVSREVCEKTVLEYLEKLDNEGIITIK